jgi:hypothetical protein
MLKIYIENKDIITYLSISCIFNYILSNLICFIYIKIIGMKGKRGGERKVVGEYECK